MKRPKTSKRTSIGKQYAILAECPMQAILNELSSRVEYHGNNKHKKVPFWGNPPRADTRGNLCPDDIACATEENRLEIQEWLRNAVRRGAIDSRWEQGKFPKHIWYLRGEIMFEAKLHTSPFGEIGGYHGYPLPDKQKWPRRYEKVFGDD